jgi:hypothetical protein
MNGIAFGQAAFNNHVKSQQTFDIAYSIEENNYNGTSNTQLLIKDIQVENE